MERGGDEFRTPVQTSGLILGGASVPAGFPRTPQVVVEASIAGVVEAADALVRSARLD